MYNILALMMDLKSENYLIKERKIIPKDRTNDIIINVMQLLFFKC